jgi:hypothetical protein
MGIRKPGLGDLVRRVQGEPFDRRHLGPARAVIQCRRHGTNWRTVGWVHGNAVMGTTSPDDFPHDVRATYEVFVSCKDCPRRFLLDLDAIRGELGKPHRGLLKLDVDQVVRVSKGASGN